MSGIKAVYGLSGSGVPSGVNVSGTQRIGVTQTDASLPAVNIIYSFRITANAPSDVATLTLSTGAIVKTTGSPDVTRFGSAVGELAAVDFEGVALPTMATGFAILVKRNENGGVGDSVDVISSSADNPSISLANIDGLPPLLSPLNAVGTIAFSFNADGDYVDVTIAGTAS